jgi:hypothetical protein
MRPFFGWAPTSAIPSRYIHLSKRQLKERVLKDANIDAAARREHQGTSQDVASAITATIEALAKRGLLGGSRRDDDGTPAPLASK